MAADGCMGWRTWVPRGPARPARGAAQFKLDEAVLSVGAAYHTALATEYLAAQAAGAAREEL
jgi:hypothetical protein